LNSCFDILSQDEDRLVNELIGTILSVAFAYLIGSIPVGLIVVWLLTGQDVREVGSGRTGGTNAMRAAGLGAGVLTAFGDMAKGIASIMLTRLIVPGLDLAEALSGIAVVAGHNWPIYIKFKGGAGTGPNVGAATALWPMLALVMIPTVPLVLFTTGYASVASTVACATIVAIFIGRALIAKQPVAHVAYTIVALILVMIALRPNYKRLLEGTERMVGPRAKGQTKSVDSANEN
jgi:glycerol-3-phosphate acyltransferase PlsY